MSKSIYRGYDIEQRSSDGRWNITLDGKIVCYGQPSEEAAQNWVDQAKKTATRQKKEAEHD